MSADGGAGDRPLRFLVVEDDPTNRLLLRAVLGRAADPSVRGADVNEATTLQEARDVLAVHRPDLIFLDIRLPDGNGLDLARELLAAPAERHPCLLVMSASVLQADRDLVMASGCDAFVGKPYRPQELLDAIGGLLERAPAGSG
ncbi:MAG: two-component system, OmpR family, operon response regulator KdpE [Chloroflexota bacterium]|nr:two-component system, OmpR family, operon response regulator KdpE [Chloroflexota bacterium]